MYISLVWGRIKVNFRRQLVESNLVIVAKQFDFSVLTNIWLVKRNIFSIDEIQEKSVFPIVAEARSSDFTFVLMPDRMQFWLATTCETANELLSTKIARLITELPPQPYIATGFNFTYHVLLDGGEIGEFTRSLFYQPESALFRTFDSEDARFGGYFSKDVLGTRLRLEAKPITLHKDKEILEEGLQFAFNFNLNLSSAKGKEGILEFLQQWDKAKEVTSSIMDTIEMREQL